MKQRWRSVPRLFQVYLMIASVVLLIVLLMVTMTGSAVLPVVRTSGQSSSPVTDKQISGKDNSVGHESLPSPEHAVQNPPLHPLHEQIPKPKSPADSHSSRESKGESEELFTFRPKDSDREINYYTDLKQQSLNSDQEEVIAAIKGSWDAYHSHAWGADHLRPVSKTSQDWFHVGLTIIDSLDTLLIAGPEMEYAVKQAMDWIKKDLTFDKYQDVNCFEMTIRVLGGLLSSFHLTKDPNLLHPAVDVADRLIHCFDSGSGIPFSDVNLRTKSPASPSWSPDSSLSEVSSMQLEMRDVSRLTSDPRFEEKSFATSRHLHDLMIKRSDPLMPMYVNPNTGNLAAASTVTLGARGDSYYEYLLKQFLQTNITWLRDDYLDAIQAVKERLMRRTPGPLKLLYVGELLRGGSDFHPKMDHLTCFLPGTLALGYYHMQVLRKKRTGDRVYRGHAIPDPTAGQTEGQNGDEEKVADRFADHLSLAEDLARTCYHTYNMTATGLAPEITFFGVAQGETEVFVKSADRHNLLRPEYVESLFYLFHVTGKKEYRDQGRAILKSFNKYSRVPTGGYTTIDDVTNPDRVRPRNLQESFWLAETLKYLFLLFSDDQQLVHKILDHYVMNTEGHLIPLTV